MHRHSEPNEKEIEERLKNLILSAEPDAPTKSKPRKIITHLLFVTTAILLTAPLWIGWANQSEIPEEPDSYQIKRVTIEDPDAIEPTIKLKPSRAGCAFMPEVKKTSALKSI